MSLDTKRSPPKTPVIIFVLLEAMIPVSGVTSWVRILRKQLLDRDLEVRVFVQTRRKDLLADDIDSTFYTIKEFHILLEEIQTGYLVLMNTSSFVLFAMSAGVLNRSDSMLKTISVLHSDSDKEYYSNLDFFDRSAQHFICVNTEIYKQTKNRLARKSAQGISVLPCAVVCPVYVDKSLHNGPIRIVYSGRIVQTQKRILDFVELIDHMVNINLEFTITFFGSGPEEVKLKRSLSKHVKNGTVKFAGEVPHQLMLERWKEFDIFVNLSDYEGTSVSMLEAMAYGVVPVVTQASSGVSEVIRNGENGNYRPVGAVREIAECIQKLDKSRSTLDSMSLHSRQTIKDHYTIEKYTESFLSILKEVDTKDPYVATDYEVDIYDHICNREEDIMRIVTSWSYRIGRKATSPFRLIKTLISQYYSV